MRRACRGRDLDTGHIGLMIKLLISWIPAVTWAAFLFFLSSRTDVPGADTFHINDIVVHFGLFAVLGVTLARGGWRSAKPSPIAPSAQLFLVLIRYPFRGLGRMAPVVRSRSRALNGRLLGRRPGCGDGSPVCPMVTSSTAVCTWLMSGIRCGLRVILPYLISGEIPAFRYPLNPFRGGLSCVDR